MKARLPQGYGKQGLNDMMKQAQQMQDMMQAKQTELEETEYQVSSAGGAIEITIMGTYQVSAVRINPELAEDIEMLEDMMGAAFNEAVRTVKEASEKEMGDISGGFDLAGLGL